MSVLLQAGSTDARATEAIYTSNVNMRTLEPVCWLILKSLQWHVLPENADEEVTVFILWRSTENQTKRNWAVHKRDVQGHSYSLSPSAAAFSPNITRHFKEIIHESTKCKKKKNVKKMSLWHWRFVFCLKQMIVCLRLFPCLAFDALNYYRASYSYLCYIFHCCLSQKHDPFKSNRSHLSAGS